MRSSRSDRLLAGGATLLTTLAALVVFSTTATAQEATRVVGSEFSVSRNEAALRLDLADGRSMDIALRNNQVFIDGVAVGSAPRGSELDRSWRELLNRSMDASAEALPDVLVTWEPPSSDVAARLSRAIGEALQPPGEAVQSPAAVAPATPDGGPWSDSVVRLVTRIGELERLVADLESSAVERARTPRRARASPFRHIAQGLSGIFSGLMTMVVVFGIGFLVILFGGRRYIEGVADTARRAPGRSLAVGMAAAFLAVPAFVLGIIALVISVIGIPLAILWVIAFPFALMGAVVLGYLGIAHATGEAFAERRFYMTDWFERGNSYYFLASGLAVLMSFFLASQVVHMAGPWLGFISGMLVFFGCVITFLAVGIGFGAVLVSRAGTRPFRARSPLAEEQDMFAEGAGV